METWRNEQWRVATNPLHGKVLNALQGLLGGHTDRYEKDYSWEGLNTSFDVKDIEDVLKGLGMKRTKKGPKRSSEWEKNDVYVSVQDKGRLSVYLEDHDF